MLTSQQVLDLAVSDPTPGRSGQVEAFRRTVRGHDFSRGAGYYVGGRQQTDLVTEGFLDAMSAQTTTAAPAKYVHPAQLAQAAPPKVTGVDAQGKPVYAEPGDLGPADLMWLERLPRDPTEVTHSDAVALAGIAASVGRKPLTDPDRRLIESIWGPVRDHHDLAAARVDLANAQRPSAPVPAEAADALAQAIAAEVPGLHWAEAHQRAHDQLRDAVAARDTERTIRIAQTEARIAELTAAQQARTAVAV